MQADRHIPREKRMCGSVGHVEFNCQRGFQVKCSEVHWIKGSEPESWIWESPIFRWRSTGSFGRMWGGGQGARREPGEQWPKGHSQESWKIRLDFSNGVKIIRCPERPSHVEAKSGRGWVQWGDVAKGQMQSEEVNKGALKIQRHQHRHFQRLGCERRHERAGQAGKPK